LLLLELMTKNFSTFALECLVVGFAAAQILNWVSVSLYEKEDEQTRRREEQMRGRQAYDVAVERLARLFGRELSTEQIRFWGWKFHRAIGVAGGAQYIALRRSYPAVRKAWGALFGTAFFLVVDEFLVYLFRLVPGPRSLPWKVHARNALSYVAHGMAAESVAWAMDRAEAARG
jgi:hypothetical protein